MEVGPHTPCQELASQSSSLGDMFRRRVQASDANAAYYSKHSGAWVKTTWSGFYRQAAQAARGMVEHGLTSGDAIAVLCPTAGPWATFDMGAQLAGLVSLGLYPKQSAEQLRYLIDHSGARLVFVESKDELLNVLEAAEHCPRLDGIVPWSDALYNEMQDHPRILNPKAFVGEPLDEASITQRLDATDRHSTAILVYTSGTTGPPKGAMITHHNIVSILGQQEDFSVLYQDDIALSFLPMAHVAERVLSFYGRISMGMATAYASNVRSVLTELQEVKPTIFGGVPRIFEKAYGKIQSELETKPPLVRAIFDWAETLGKRRARCLVAKQPVPPLVELQWKLADYLVYRKIRAAFGGRCRQIITGAAPMGLDLLEFYWGIGLPVFEAYGMTESTVITHANHEGAVRLGTVGKPLPGIECRIAEDGEVLVRGESVFKGYLHNEEATRNAVIEGWLHTGDIGTIDSDGFLTITDRKKHLIITAGGKNLAPANIQNAIKNQDPLINQVLAHGDRRPYVSALVSPAPIETLEWGEKRGLATQADITHHTQELMDNPTGRSPELNALMANVVVHPDYQDRISKAVREGNKDLAQVEKVKRFVILHRDFSMEEGELTPTMKLRRKAVQEKYADMLDRIYNEDGFALQP